MIPFSIYSCVKSFRYVCYVFFPCRNFIIFNFCALQHPNAECVSEYVCEAHFHVYIYDAIWFPCDMYQMYSYFTIQAYIPRTLYEPWGGSIAPQPPNHNNFTILCVCGFRIILLQSLTFYRVEKFSLPWIVCHVHTCTRFLSFSLSLKFYVLVFSSGKLILSYYPRTFVSRSCISFASLFVCLPHFASLVLLCSRFLYACCEA